MTFHSQVEAVGVKRTGRSCRWAKDLMLSLACIKGSIKDLVYKSILMVRYLMSGSVLNIRFGVRAGFQIVINEPDLINLYTFQQFMCSKQIEIDGACFIFVFFSEAYHKGSLGIWLRLNISIGTGILWNARKM